MKYVVIIPDGAADEPLESLGGKTPLESAHTPAMDQISALGVLGEAEFVPQGYPVGSDVAVMGLLGLDPRQHYCGRASLEALGRGIELAEGQWAIRCNLVTLEQGHLSDATAGGISSEEAEELIQHANAQLSESPLGSASLRLVSGLGYRQLLILSEPVDGSGGLSPDTRMISPNDLAGQPIQDAFPRGPQSQWLCELMDSSVEWFADHPVNQRRRAEGKPEATCLWFWGAGRTPGQVSFSERYGKSAAIIAAVDVVQGLGKMLGLARIQVPTATGMPDTDYCAKGKAACEALDQADVVVVHIEAPDEAAHQGNAEAKVAALEAIDRDIVAPLLARLDGEEWRVLVVPDHQTWTRTRRHHRGLVCFAAAGKGIAADDWNRLSESDAARSSLKFHEGWNLLPWFLGS